MELNSNFDRPPPDVSDAQHSAGCGAAEFDWETAGRVDHEEHQRVDDHELRAGGTLGFIFQGGHHDHERADGGSANRDVQQPGAAPCC